MANTLLIQNVTGDGECLFRSLFFRYEIMKNFTQHSGNTETLNHVNKQVVK
jgi:hypothetical protein